MFILEYLETNLKFTVLHTLRVDNQLIMVNNNNSKQRTTMETQLGIPANWLKDSFCKKKSRYKNFVRDVNPLSFFPLKM